MAWVESRRVESRRSIEKSSFSRERDSFAVNVVSNVIHYGWQNGNYLFTSHRKFRFVAEHPAAMHHGSGGGVAATLLTLVLLLFMII